MGHSKVFDGLIHIILIISLISYLKLPKFSWFRFLICKDCVCICVCVVRIRTIQLEFFRCSLER